MYNTCKNNEIIKNIRNKKPIVHCITNYVTANDCANAVLAIGSSPIMADEECEVEDILSLSSCLVINIGTINSNKIKAVLKACEFANKINKPIVLDPVGVSACAFRKDIIKELLDKVHFTVIKGNLTEINTLSNFAIKSGGVDVSKNDVITENNINDICKSVQKLSEKLDCIIAVTGEKDIVAYKNNIAVISNGVSAMSKITGTGCMLSAICGAFISTDINNAFESTISSICCMGICGQRAYSLTAEKGTGSMRVELINQLSLFTDSILQEEKKVEYRKST